MFDFSPVQILLVLAIALVVFGPKRLPELARSVGRGVREFKEGITSDDDAPRTPPASQRAVIAPAEVPATTATPPAEDPAPPHGDPLDDLVRAGDDQPPDARG